MSQQADSFLRGYDRETVRSEVIKQRSKCQTTCFGYVDVILIYKNGY